MILKCLVDFETTQAWSIRSGKIASSFIRIACHQLFSIDRFILRGAIYVAKKQLIMGLAHFEACFLKWWEKMHSRLYLLLSTQAVPRGAKRQEAAYAHLLYLACMTLSTRCGVYIILLAFYSCHNWGHWGQCHQMASFPLVITYIFSVI